MLDDFRLSMIPEIGLNTNDMVKSLKYGRMIQDAILCTRTHVRHLFGEFCILYEPKNILSGDFYFCYRKNNISYLAVCDCTGHGFAGALLTILGHNMLEKCIRRRNNLSDVLSELNSNIIHSFDSKSKIVGLGMDISLIAINNQTRTIDFAGARRPVWIFSNGELKCFKTDRQSIGENIKHKWTQQQYQMNAGDKIFLFTDGITDQFGDTNQEKFGIKRLKEFLELNAHQPILTIETLLTKEFENHKKNELNTDDILFMGLQIE